MENLKNYVINNSETLFRSVKSNNAIIFDNRGFFFSDEAQNKYDQIKNTPHLYVAWTEHIKGFNYIGISNQPRGRWQRSHAYHMGTLAYHLLETLNKYDQNHKHWIDNWMQIESLNLGDNEHNINLNQEVKICFIPFELYTNKDYNLLDKNDIKKINKKTEEDLIKSYLSDNLTLLNVQKNNNSKKIIKQIPKINLIKANSNSDENCVTFEVKRNENISIVADSISNLPTGPCSIELFYSNRADVRIYINGRKRNISTANRTVSQYFIAPDTANGNIPKWKIVQNEMNKPNKIINKITVKVCKIVNNRNTKPKTENNVVPKSPKVEIRNKIQNTSIDNKIDSLLESLDWDKLKDKKTPKLLIIGCSDSKTLGGTKELMYDYFNNGNYINLIANRNIRKNLQYESLLLNTPNYFERNKRGNADYFNFQINSPLYKPALDRYSGGKFYTKEHLQLYRQKNQNSNLHILIISGLYGLIEFRDSIIDYHLEIKRKPFWNNSNNISINDAVKKYIEQNEIANEMVFYSLSQSGKYSYSKALKPIKTWNKMWITGEGDSNGTANLQYSANCVLRFLNQLL